MAVPGLLAMPEPPPPPDPQAANAATPKSPSALSSQGALLAVHQECRIAALVMAIVPSRHTLKAVAYSRQLFLCPICLERGWSPGVDCEDIEQCGVRGSGGRQLRSAAWVVPAVRCAPASDHEALVPP